MAILGLANSLISNYESFIATAFRIAGSGDFLRLSNNYSYNYNRYDSTLYKNFLTVPSFSIRQSYSDYNSVDYSRISDSISGSSYSNSWSRYSSNSIYDRYASGHNRSVFGTGYNRLNTNTQQGPSQYSRATNQVRYTTVGTAPAVEEALRLAWQEYDRGVKEITKNDSARITEYRGCSADRPWCASFSSWLYGRGQGSNNACTFGFTESSQAIAKRADKAGHFANKNSGYRPQVGDLMILKYADGIHGHVGIVVEVHDDGTFATIEGNYSNKVDKVNRSMNTKDLYGFVKMNEWLQNS